MMPSRRPLGVVKQWATSGYTATAAVSAAPVSVTLPQNAVGKPVKMKVSGSVAGYVTLEIGNGAQITAMVNPNALYDEVDIPASAFPNLVSSVAVEVTASGAGLVVVSIGFA